MGKSFTREEPSFTKLLGILVAVCLAAQVLTAGIGHLYNETDGQYGGAAKVMAEGGSWLIPENNGVPRLVKPPLLYWAMAGAMKVFGVNEFSARLPNALALTAWAVATFILGSLWAGPWRGFVAGLILVTMLGSFTLARIVMPEPLFAALIAWALVCAAKGVTDEPKRKLWFLGFWLCAALAAFTKGWHGFLYPLAIVAVTALFHAPSRHALKGLLSWQGALIFLAINAPWFAYVESQFPGYLRNLIFSEQIGHVTGSEAPATSFTNVPRLQFFALHIAWFFPWSLAAGVALLCRKDEGVKGHRFETVLIATWGLLIAGSLLVVGQRQDYYAMAAWPAFALAAAAITTRAGVRIGSGLVAALLLLGLIAAALLPGFLEGRETATVAERSTAMNTVLNFGPEVWGSLTTTALWALGGALVFAALGALSRSSKVGVCALAACGLCLGWGAVSGMSIVSPFFSLAQTADEFVENRPDGLRVVFEGDIDTGSSLLFYTKERLHLLGPSPDQDFIVRTQGIGRDSFWNEEIFLKEWNSSVPVILVTESANLPSWEARMGIAPRVLTRCGTQVLVANFSR